MDILDALDDTKAMNKRKLNVDTSKIIGKMRDSKEALAKEAIELGDEEEDLVEQTEFAGSSRRIGEEEEEVIKVFSTITITKATLTKISKMTKRVIEATFLASASANLDNCRNRQ